MKDQISNIKDQIYRAKIKYIFNFLFVFFIFNFLSLILVSSANAQYVRYPIKELGNCRNNQECYLYCQIPENTPVCWSYNKYVVNANVLGETTTPNLTYPIVELGNCADGQACFIYCNQPKNQNACFSYARSKGLVKEEAQKEEGPPSEVIAAAKTELGCDSKEACGAICSQAENREKCFAFAKKHGLYKKHENENRPTPPPDIMEKAQAELGCTSQETCMQMCQNPENTQKCIDFGKKHNLMREEEIERFEEHKKEFAEYAEKKAQMMQEAKSELGCDSYESCSSFCSKEENREKCMDLGRKHGMMQNAQDNMSDNANVARPKNCTSEKECREYCEKYPNECRGFSDQKREEAQQFRPETQNGTAQGKRESKLKEGAFLGPKGCTSEKECQAYCKEHADECPGFPPSPAGGQDKFSPANAPLSPYPQKITPGRELLEKQARPSEYKPENYSSPSSPPPQF